MLAGGGYRWMRDWPNKERSFTNIHVTSLMLFIHFHIVLQSNAKQCRDSIISHSKAWITSGFCKRVLMKTLLCASLMHPSVARSSQCLWEANLFNSGSSYTQHSPSSWNSYRNTEQWELLHSTSEVFLKVKLQCCHWSLWDVWNLKFPVRRLHFHFHHSYGCDMPHTLCLLSLVSTTTTQAQRDRDAC